MAMHSPISATRRMLFSVGLLVAVVLGLGGLALYQYASSMIVDVDWDLTFEQSEQQIDQLSPSQLLSVWSQSQVEQGLSEWQEQDLASFNTQGEILCNVAYGMWLIAALGGLLCGWSVWTGRQQQRPPQN